MDELVERLRKPRHWCCIFMHEGVAIHGTNKAPLEAADRIEQLTRRVEELEGERDKLTEDYLFCKRQWHQEAERAENLENKARSSDVSGEGV